MTRARLAIAAIAAIMVALTFRVVGFSTQPEQPPRPPMEQKPNTPAKELIEPAAEPDEKMFPDGVSHDFGFTARGVQLYHAFRIVNTTDKPLRILSVRVSMNRTLSVSSNKDVLQPNEEGKIELICYTNMFVGTKYSTVYVQTEGTKLLEHRFWTAAISRDDVAYSPDKLDFGKITRGKTPTAHVTVTVSGQPKLQVTKASSNSKFIEVQVKELDRDKSQAIFQVSAVVRNDIPAGELRTDVEITTNNPAMPKLLVPLSVSVELPK